MAKFICVLIKKSKFSFILLLLMSHFTFSQTADLKFGIGGHLGISDYYGDLNTEFFDLGKTARNQGGLTFSYYLTPLFDVAASCTYGAIGYDQAFGPSFGANLFQANAQFRFKFHNGFILKETSKIQPYIFIGTGLADYANVSIFTDVTFNTLPQTDFTLNAGLGATYMIFDKWGINYTLLYAHTNGDQKDGFAGYSGGWDQFMIHQAGIVYLLGNAKDTDGDCIPDKRDECPDTPKGVSVDDDGCPIDTDGDGIPDYLDKCAEIPGIAEFEGCPDTDGDGIQDSEDECPEVPGVVSAQGCPDRDGDGIVDDEDKCPDTPGLEQFDGCPDTDGDGIIDSDDACPTVPGIIELKGCPDTDGDGIPDQEDKCPTIPGVESNMGCPEIADETMEVFQRALKGIQFESGRDVIKRSSYGILNDVVEIMKKNPSYILTIDGHTDSQGDDAKNQTLSENRAAAVKKYLVNKGVDEARLTSRGFGETQPKATNETAAGRAENRRVEFTVEFSSGNDDESNNISTKVIIPSDMVDQEMKEGVLSAQIIYEDKPGEYPENTGIVLVNGNGQEIQSTIIDQNGNFEFKNIPTDKDYYLKIDNGASNMLLLVYNNQGNVKVELRTNKDGSFYYKEITDNIAAELNQLAENRDEFELESQTVWGTLDHDPENAEKKGGQIINAYNEAGELVGTAITDENGVFRFRNLPVAETFLFKFASDQQEFVLENYTLYIYDRSRQKTAQLKSGEEEAFTFRPLGYDNMIDLDQLEEDNLNFILSEKKNGNAILVHYDVNKEEVKDSDIERLNKIYQTLAANPEIKVEINSYTDSKSSEDYNLLLSERRGEWIVAYFVKKGIDVKRFSINAYGETMLVDPENDAANRRAEIHLY